MSTAAINQEMTIAEIVKTHPGTADVFAQHGIRVDGYKALEHETVFATAQVHQIDLDALLKDLNKVAK